MVTPSSSLETTGPFAGELVFVDRNEIVTIPMAASTKILGGQLVTFDSSGNAVLATDTTGTVADGIGIARYTVDNSAGLAAALSIQVSVGNTYAYSLAAGSIKPQSLLKANSGSYLVASTSPATSTVTTSATIDSAISAVRDYFGKAVGRYFGHSKEEKLETAAVSSDIIAVRLGL